MEITYTTTLEDYVTFNRHLAWKTTFVWVIFLLGWFITIGALVPYVLFALLENDWLVVLFYVVFGLLAAVGYPLFIWWFYAIVIRMFARARGTRGMLGRITLVLTESSLIEITETTRTEVRWENIREVDAARDYTFIFITGLSAVILPRHGCVCDEDYDEVREFVLSQVGHLAKESAVNDRPLN